ncbi:MAG: alpha/beta fold hydrolase [Betaproteobacteria bacterium]
MSWPSAAGSGPDLVLLHGWGSHAGVWRTLAGHLAGRFRVHAPVLPYAAAGSAYEAHTVEEIARHLAANAPGKCVVCGWSLGGLVALAWARQAPEQISRLALMATSPCFVQRDDWPHALTVAALGDFGDDLARDTATALARYIALQARGDAHALRVARYLRQTLSETVQQADTRALQSGLLMLSRTDLRRDLAAIGQPAMLMHGDRDAVVPLAAGEYLAQNLPAARMVITPGAGHAAFASRPGPTSAHLASFFDGC